MSPTILSKNLILLFSLIFLLAVISCEKTDLSSLGNNIVCYSAAYNKGVYKSDNGGISWYPLVTGQEDIYLYYKKLFLSPDNKRLYITTTGEGLFFVDMEKNILNRAEEFQDEDISSVAFRAVSNGQGADFEVFAAFREAGIYRSVPGTDEWESFNDGLTYREVNTLYAYAGELYAGTVNGIFRLDNSSMAWEDISGGIKNKNITSISSDIAGKTIYAGTGAYQDKKGSFEGIPSLYKSSDNGKTWEKSDRGLPDGVLIFSIAVNPLKQERIYLGTSDGIYRSTNGGNRWSKTDKGLPEELRILDIRIARGADNIDLVYAAGANGVFIGSDEKNPIWKSRKYGLDETYISSILVQAYK